ncbi:MAG TPA: cyclodeaminase/cyclohydrolase family protein [Vicinamibacterales bacterium]|nr:cyclodeaminase/cyclohydrolase family protein [Vicinamibacterales bacterium]
MSFSDLRVSDFLDQLASAEPTPGGGTAAAIAGAMGTALLMMVAGLVRTRRGTDQERVRLSEARAALAGVRARLAALADTDADAFDQVMSAYRMPKSTDDQKRARIDAVQVALKAATTVPLDTVRAVADAMRLARTVGEDGNRSARSDVGAAVGLLKAAADGAAANVKINLEGVRDEPFRSVTTTQLEEILRRVDRDAAEIRRSIESD